MYEGYLAVNAVEILNAQRAEQYISTGLPHLQRKCTTEGLNTALGHGAYTDPVTDRAPWYIPENPESAKFLGLMPEGIKGASNASRSVETTEKIGDGAVHSTPRHASKEIRVTATAFAITEEALSIGLAWLRHILTERDCASVFGSGCTGRDMTLFSALPTKVQTGALNLRRTFYMVEVIDGPMVVENVPLNTGFAKKVEFVFRAGKPWAFSPVTNLTSGIVLASGFSYSDVASDCSSRANPYDDFINDPFFTAIQKPPLPPVMKPPNILKITSWRRSIVNVPATLAKQWGGLTPVLRVRATANAQQIRIRFWTAAGMDRGPCEYDGEFLISFIPAGAMLIIDGIRDRIQVQLANGRIVPGSHLIYGSDGLPYKWPDLLCDTTYMVVADMMPGQTGISLDLDLAIRE